MGREHGGSDFEEVVMEGVWEVQGWSERAVVEEEMRFQ